MTSAPTSTTPRRRVRRRFAAAAALLALAAGGTGAGLALAASGATTVKAAANSKLGETIVVSADGRTVYALSPETTKHLICTSATCMSVWPPLTVKSRSAKIKAGHGVKGKLGILRRSNGVFQVTLGGSPLYHFAPDGTTPGAAGGNGINSFGGHWHVIKATASKSSPAPSTPTNTTPAMTPPGY